MITTLYRKNGITYSLDQVRALHPQTSIPTGADLSDLGYTSLRPAPVPLYDKVRDGVREVEPIDGLQTWQIYPLPPEELAANLEADAVAQRARAKAARAAAVQSITVTTQAGHTFDGDETSQGRMARAILVLQATQTPTVPWVLADNTTVNVTVPELTEALALAGAEQSRLWPIDGVLA